jgi:hypothetical protein
VQEYRISTNNYSAEFGRTSGFLANGNTHRWQTVAWAGVFELSERSLDANEFQRNRAGLRRPWDKEWEPGFSGGGPLRAPHLFASGSLEYQRFRGAGDPEDVTLPTRNFIPPEGSLAQKLMQGFDAPAGPDLTRTLKLSPPYSIDRWFVVPRADYIVHEGSHRFLTRAAVVRITRPDFIWTPYKGYSSPLTQDVASIMAGWLGGRGHLTSEARTGWTVQDLRFDRAQPDVPELFAAGGILAAGQPGFYGFHNRDRSLEFVENLLWVRDRHILKFGGGVCSAPSRVT